MATLVTTEKRLQKVTQIFASFSVVLTVRWSFCVSDLVRRWSELFFQRLRGKKNETDCDENTKSDSADTSTYHQMILKVILEFRLLVGFKPTIFVSLLVIIIHQRVQFSRRRIPNDALNICLMIADRNWSDVGSQFQGLLKEMESAIGFPTAQQSQRIDITYFVFLRSISFRSEKSSRVAAVLNSHQQWSATCKYQYKGKSSFLRR